MENKHVIIKCSNCRKSLVDICIYNTTKPFKWKGRANCPYCGDMSFITEWEGQFSYCGILKPVSDEVDPHDAEPLTKVVEISPDENDEVLLIKVVACEKK